MPPLFTAGFVTFFFFFGGFGLSPSDVAATPLLPFAAAVVEGALFLTAGTAAAGAGVAPDAVFEAPALSSGFAVEAGFFFFFTFFSSDFDDRGASSPSSFAFFSLASLPSPVFFFFFTVPLVFFPPAGFAAEAAPPATSGSSSLSSLVPLLSLIEEDAFGFGFGFGFDAAGVTSLPVFSCFTALLSLFEGAGFFFFFFFVGGDCRAAND
mmetsp:Transcript_30709/g.80258  ORF Transcript_30709/g.80258 Transcript_30709/m.80258 type:complete len:209 (-) Transcript_30709:1497-2123(-)